MRVMAHLVAGYTSASIAEAAAEGLASGGIAYFEIQFPFSDPSADGKAIQSACSQVLSGGWTLSEGFSFVRTLSRRYPSIPVYIMSYANLAYKTGIPRFVETCAEAGCKGFIIPDLPFDSDEGLALMCAKTGLLSIPVVAPSMRPARIAQLSALNPPLVYAALRAGITGSQTIIDEQTLSFLRSVDAAPGTPSRILAGFGIRTGEQARQLAGQVHAVVAGSVFVDLIRENADLGTDRVQNAVALKAGELSGFA